MNQSDEVLEALAHLCQRGRVPADDPKAFGWTILSALDGGADPERWEAAYQWVALVSRPAV